MKILGIHAELKFIRSTIYTWIYAWWSFRNILSVHGWFVRW